MKRILTILLAATILASCGGDKSPSKNEANLAKLKEDRSKLDEKIRKAEGARVDTSRKAVPVAVMEVQPTAFNAYIEVQSQITSDENINANTQSSMPAVVRSITVHVGQRVNKGQVLATLDASTIEQQILGLEPNIILARTIYEKTKALWAQQIGTEVQLLTAKANYESALKGRESLVAQRNLFRIVSPISGTIDQINLKVGDLASAASPNGIRVVSTDRLKAEANLGENYLGKVKAGDPVFLILPDINDSIRTALTYVAQAIDPISRSFNVQVRLGSNKKLHPNMSCRMRITNYASANAISVPVSVIQKTSQGDQLMVADGTTAKLVTVTTGRNANGRVEILSGLKAGDKVITEGYADIDNGELIEIR